MAFLGLGAGSSAQAAATNWVCTLHGWPVHEVEEYKYFVGNGAPKLLERVVPEGVPVTDELRRVTQNENLCDWSMAEESK